MGIPDQFKILILDLISGMKASHPISIPARLMIVSWTIEIFVILYFVLWSLIARKLALEVLQGPGVKILILSVWFSVWAFLNNRKYWARRYFQLLSVSASGCAFSSCRCNLPNGWMPGAHNHRIILYSWHQHSCEEKYIYWPLQNNAWSNFLWRALVCSLSSFPDHSYPALVAIWGTEAFNITTFSLVLAALAAVTIYLILSQLIRTGWIQLSRSGAIWLTALFSFGTVYWWLSINTGRVFLARLSRYFSLNWLSCQCWRSGQPGSQGLPGAAILCAECICSLAGIISHCHTEQLECRKGELEIYTQVGFAICVACDRWSILPAIL